MKRLTINRIARAGIQANRRGYRALASGIFLSVFLISTLCLAVQGLLLAREAQTAQRLGYGDCLLLSDDATDEQALSTGLFDRVGHIYVTACVPQADRYLGYYDEEGASLLNRRLLEGRMPEQPGEVAIERSVLESLRVDEAQLGDSLALSLLPIDGLETSREFTLVGFLAEQNRYLDPKASGIMFSDGGVYSLPSLLTVPQESFKSGRTVTHRILTLARGQTLRQAFAYEDEHMLAGNPAWSGTLVGIDEQGCTLSVYDDRLTQRLNSLMPTLVPMALLGLSMILATCIAISSAMEGQLARKTEEIGMLRAVGATRRQIRRIFGREAWVLAFALALPGIGCGCLAAWLAARLYPEQFVFAPSPLLLLPIALLSMGCILLSARLPLRRCAQIMPMGVLRDTALLRKSRRIVKEKRRFRPASLIARRQNRLHPSRALGASLLVGLMLFCMSIVSYASSYMLTAVAADVPEFSLYCLQYSYANSFIDNLSPRTLTDADMAQIAALPGVERVDVVREVQGALALDELPESLRKQSVAQGIEFEMTEEEYRQFISSLFQGDETMPSPEEVDMVNWRHGQISYQAAKDALGISPEGALHPMDIMICDLDALALSPYVTDGKIDLKAVDAGQEVLLFAPDMYTLRDGSRTTYTFFPPDMAYESVSRLENDAFRAGQTLRLLQLYTTDAPYEMIENTALYDDYYRLYQSAEKQDVNVRVGAVLKDRLSDALPDVWDPCILTTPAGAQALGLYANRFTNADIDLQNDLDDETLDDLSSRIELISLRGDQVNVRNRVRDARENAAYERQLLSIFIGIVLLFFAVSVALITGGITRRIRADQRMIGTLRAVGADAKTIAGCYQPQVSLSIGLGLVIGLAGVGLLLCYLLSSGSLQGGKAWLFAAVMPGSALLLAALCLIACLLILRVRIREIMNRSIVENIKEL